MTGIYRKTKTSLDRIFINEDVELDFEDFDDEEAGEETVQITAAAITQICKIYADEDEEQRCPDHSGRQVHHGHGGRCRH